MPDAERWHAFAAPARRTPPCRLPRRALQACPGVEKVMVKTCGFQKMKAGDEEWQFVRRFPHCSGQGLCDTELSMSVTAYIALGSNLGDRQDFLERALKELQEQPGLTVSRVSSFYETAPVGGPPGQGAYLNAVAELQTDLDSHRLLARLLEVE